MVSPQPSLTSRTGTEGLRRRTAAMSAGEGMAEKHQFKGHAPDALDGLRNAGSVHDADAGCFEDGGPAPEEDGIGTDMDCGQHGTTEDGADRNRGPAI